MIIRIKVLVREQRFDYIPEFLLAARSLEETDLKYCFLAF